ncbi:MAG: response regulator [Ardenticatenaceae bacterium]|nr:response regulator [Anaerolineales bacterium]MCB8921391.1 response regulator [Ardenticatenaceae bacterium]MCB8991513.1 response regulator [Ardenticatenaceae bacterium]
MATKRTPVSLLKILLVEDNPAHAELITRSLEDHEIPSDIFHVNDGEKALDFLYRRGQFANLAENTLPNVILLDIRMPKMSGLEVLKEIKLSPSLRHIPVIMLTTSEAEQDVSAAYKNYANSYLVKPVEFSKFIELMEEIGYYWLGWNHHKLA